MTTTRIDARLGSPGHRNCWDRTVLRGLTLVAEQDERGKTWRYISSAAQARRGQIITVWSGCADESGRFWIVRVDPDVAVTTIQGDTEGSDAAQLGGEATTWTWGWQRRFAVHLALRDYGEHDLLPAAEPRWKQMWGCHEQDLP